MSKQSGAATRATAARVVDAVLTDGRNLDAALAGLLNAELSDRDQSLVKALAYGTLRTHLRNRALLKALLQKPLKKKDGDIQLVLLMALYELQECRTPDYAIINEAVEQYLKDRIAYLEDLDRAVASIDTHPTYTADEVFGWMSTWGTEDEKPLEKAALSPSRSSQ